MKNYICFALIIVLVSGSAEASSFDTGGLETHIGVNSAVFVPWHHRTVAYGYGFSLVMRPSYAKYLFDQLEQWNLGLALQSTSQHVSDGFIFRDTIASLRYYFNRGDFGPGWESGFVGAGIGLATVSWSGNGSTGSRKNKDYILEAGYEFDIENTFKLPLIFMFHINYRLIDIEPVSYTGMGVAISICYGVSD